jgi:exodeoxyribonuclease III
MKTNNEKRFCSWNVNGLRAVYNKGYESWLLSELPDFLGLQEIKCEPDQVEALLAPAREYYDIVLVPALKKGYSGVAAFIKKDWRPLSIDTQLGVEEFDCEGRTVIVHFDECAVLNCYFPNGQRDHNRVPYKLAYSRAILQRARELESKLKKPIFIMGDFNTAHHPIDLANPESNKKTTGFLPEERVFLDECEQVGFVDSFRHFYPNEPDHYTWWTYRNQCRERNIGWRIDYVFASPLGVKSMKEAYHSPEVQGSDHCPIWLKASFPST